MYDPICVNAQDRHSEKNSGKGIVLPFLRLKHPQTERTRDRAGQGWRKSALTSSLLLLPLVESNVKPESTPARLHKPEESDP